MHLESVEHETLKECVYVVKINFKKISRYKKYEDFRLIFHEADLAQWVESEGEKGLHRFKNKAIMWKQFQGKNKSSAYGNLNLTSDIIFLKIICYNGNLRVKYVLEVLFYSIANCKLQTKLMYHPLIKIFLHIWLHMTYSKKVQKFCHN